jgi:hypothetical protein
MTSEKVAGLSCQREKMCCGVVSLHPQTFFFQMIIEFQFFNGCPNAGETLQNLQEVITELGISDEQLKISVVPDIDTAKRLCFQGSPSILVNRKDIYTGMEPTGFSYACRMYEFDGERIGVITKEYIRKRLAGKG